ncbi:MATE family efflux transporter [Intestinibaculum porci]|uniref:Probable multidrug resistance protein NorM n=1 Tax=Intestinibaculum porci TaxID=2487118 RepID=A0A3G9JJR3_9FIRM|nr:MATE family efflux transporter [Intestinibaculum porci]BBH25233.1 MATE family efflux transporter [Intestinibaculum porci]
MRTIDFTKGKIMKSLILFAGPVLFAMFLQALYSAADLLIVGKFATKADVSGVAIGSQLMTTLTNMIVSFATGATIYLGQKIGEKKAHEGGIIIGNAILFFGLMGLLMSLSLPLLSGPLAHLLKAPAQSFTQTKHYIMICGGGAMMIVAYNVLGAIFRGIGDSTTPLITVAIAALINVFGDLLLVNGFHMGAAGAAIATVSSQTISVIISLLMIKGRTLPFTMSKQDIRFKRTVTKQIIIFGLPIALQDFLVSLSFLVLLAIVNTLGVTASAGVGVAEKVCAFLMLVPSAFMQSMSSFVAQNKGAGKVDRAIKGVKIAIGFSSLIGLVMFVFAFFHGDMLGSIFSSDQSVIAACAQYLKAYGIDCLLTCFLFCLVGFFNGMGHTTFVMIQGLMSAFLIRIPVAYIMSMMTGKLFFIGLAIPASTIVQIIICLLYLRKRKFTASAVNL